ncbi:MAG: prepilin-type N-terminal cleavage/methylation domain-containing protein [Synergistaceae bacterium]|nr:prepilin-type N-terminal cleavage/methylation domain-containing protein [Synergistaceae bacterium]
MFVAACVFYFNKIKKGVLVVQEFRKRKGFTLIELLIVIVVIGILSAMMMLSSDEAVSSAKAAKIISDLRNLKTAALAWYADNLDFVESDKFTSLYDNTEKVLKYLGNEGVKGDYEFSDDKNGNADGSANVKKNSWFVWWRFNGDEKLLEKLISRANGVELRYTNTYRDCAPAPKILNSTVGRNNLSVGIFIRGKWGYQSSITR